MNKLIIFQVIFIEEYQLMFSEKFNTKLKIGVVHLGALPGTPANNLPVIVGSGVKTENIVILWDYADAFIVGSSFKYNGTWGNRVDHKRVKDFVNCVKN